MPWFARLASTFLHMGRPFSRSDLVPLDKVVRARVSTDEWRLVEHAAQAQGLTVSQFVRLATVGTATLPPQQLDAHMQSVGGGVPH